MIAGEGGDITVDIVMPANTSTMPDRTRSEKLVLIVLEHIWCCDVEVVDREALRHQFSIMER